MILSYLEENERLFGISVDELLIVDGHKRMPERVYRKVRPVKLKALASAASGDDDSGVTSDMQLLAEKE